MAKIDITKIAGFDGMTADQKIEALMGLDIPDAPDMSKFIAKAQFDKLASELAENKRKLLGKMTEDEQKKAEQDEKDALLKAELEQYKTQLAEVNKKLKISDYKSQFVALGYEDKLAAETAQALVDGNMAKVFENQGKHKDALEKKIKEDLMMGDPRPAGGGSDGGKDSAVEFAKNLAKSQSDGNKAAQDAIKYYS